MRALRWIQKTKLGSKLIKPTTLKSNVSIFQSEEKVIAFLKSAIEDAEALK